MSIGCKCATYDPVDGSYYCDISGDVCVFLGHSEECNISPRDEDETE